MSDTTQPSLNGTTAQAMVASTKDIIGARKNTVLSAPEGTMTSFSANFRKSAKLCSRPNGPTTLMDLRSCTAPQTLRSIHRRMASETSSSAVTKRH